MSDQPEKLTLRRKLFLAGQEAEPVEKDGTSEDGSYKFTKAKDVLAEANRVLENNGIVVIPEAGDAELRFLKNGGAIAKVSMTFEICDSEGDETIVKEWRGTGFDVPGDKAIYAAITGAKKYFFASLLNIPFGIDPEGDGEPKDQLSDADVARAKQDALAETPDIAPIVEPASPSVEDEIPADASGLDLEREGVR